MCGLEKTKKLQRGPPIDVIPVCSKLIPKTNFFFCENVLF